MMSSDVVLDRETANDEEAQVVAIHVLSGTAVLSGDLIFDIENSKATQEVVAPRDGILIHTLAIGDNVAFGVPIARVVSPEEAAGGATAPGPAEPPLEMVSPQRSAAGVLRVADPVPQEPPHPAARRLAEPRLSQAAATLLAKSGLTTLPFSMDFVTSRDVRAYLNPNTPRGPGNAAPSPQLVMPKPVMPKDGQPVAGRKRAEIEVLSSGAGGTMLSVLGASLGSLAIPRQTGSFLAGRITDLVIYEASRLMRKYPRLNAFYQDGYLVEHDAVHAGLAIDGGGRLMVYGIEHADRVALPHLADIIADAVGRYVENALTSAELSRATFTVTDLSGSELDFVLPLLPRGQSCIIGVTQSAASGFRLFVGFDHRVTEGREVAAFLGELRDRLISFAATGQQEAANVATAHCDYCGRSLADAVGKSKERGLLKIIDAQNREALCCGSCWNGW